MFRIFSINKQNRKRKSPIIRLLAILTFCLGLINCSEDDSSAPTASPGTISVSAAGITGQTDKVLVITASNPSDPSAGILGVYCQGGLTDPFSLSATLLQTFHTSGNPCEATNVTKTFDGGSYTITFSIVESGSETADKTTSVSVSVDGDGMATAPDFSTWQ